MAEIKVSRLVGKEPEDKVAMRASCQRNPVRISGFSLSFS